jgi:hypothetical protein
MSGCTEMTMFLVLYNDDRVSLCGNTSVWALMILFKQESCVWKHVGCLLGVTPLRGKRKIFKQVCGSRCIAGRSHPQGVRNSLGVAATHPCQSTWDQCEEIYICSSRLGLIKMEHRHSGNGRNSQQ